MFKRFAFAILLLLVLVSAVISAAHHWLDARHDRVVIAPDDQRLSGLLERVEALEAEDDGHDQIQADIGWNEDAIEKLSELYAELKKADEENARYMKALDDALSEFMKAGNVEPLINQVGALAVTVSELQAGIGGQNPSAGVDPRIDEIRDEIKKLWTARERNRRRICILEYSDHFDSSPDQDLAAHQAEHCG